MKLYRSMWMLSNPFIWKTNEKIFTCFSGGHQIVLHSTLCIDFQKGFWTMLEQVLCSAPWQKHLQSLRSMASVSWQTTWTWLRKHKRNHILHRMAYHHHNILRAQHYPNHGPRLPLTKHQLLQHDGYFSFYRHRHSPCIIKDAFINDIFTY